MFSSSIQNNEININSFCVPAVTCFIRLADPCVIPTMKPHGPCSSPWNGSETKSLRPVPSACAKPPGDPSISNDPTTQPGKQM